MWCGRGSGWRGAHSAHHLDEKRRQWAAAGEEVRVVDTTMPGLVRRSHPNPLLRALTSYLARKPAMWRVGGAAHARISGPTCALAGPRQCEGCANGQEALTPPHTTCPMTLCPRNQHEVVAAVRPGLPGPGLGALLGPGLVALLGPGLAAPLGPGLAALLGPGLVALLGPGLVPLRRRRGRRDPRRPPRPGAPRGPRRSRKASNGAAPTRCSSSPPRTPSQSADATNRARPPA